MSVVPLSIIPPPSAPASVGFGDDPSSKFLSSTVIVVEFTVVVLPLIVRFPPTFKSLDMLADPSISSATDGFSFPIATFPPVK